MNPGSPIGDAILRLCSRPQGFSNDIVGRALLNHLLGASKATCIRNVMSARLAKFRSRGWIESKVSPAGHSLVYKLTPLGLKHLERDLTQKRKPVGIKLTDWKRLPMTGNIRQEQIQKPETKGIALGFDSRYQLGPDEAKAFRGEFGAEWTRLRG